MKSTKSERRYLLTIAALICVVAQCFAGAASARDMALTKSGSTYAYIEVNGAAYKAQGATAQKYFVGSDDAIAFCAQLGQTDATVKTCTVKIGATSRTMTFTAGIVVPPVVTPPVDPVPVVRFTAVYGYTLTAAGALVDPKPLAGATITNKNFYVSVVPASGIALTGVRYYCCKPKAAGSRDSVDSGVHYNGPNGFLVNAAPYVQLFSILDAVVGFRELYFNSFAEVAGEENYVFFTFAPPVAVAQPVQFSWSAPSTRTNGAALAAGELTGYELQVDTAAGAPAATVATTALTTTLEIKPGSYKAAVRALAGIWSAPSNTVDFVVGN